MFRILSFIHIARLHRNPRRATCQRLQRTSAPASPHTRVRRITPASHSHSLAPIQRRPDGLGKPLATCPCTS